MDPRQLTQPRDAHTIQMNNPISTSFGALYVGEGVLAQGVAIVPGQAVINGQFNGAIDASDIQIQARGIVSGTTKAEFISVGGKINDSVQATNTLTIGNNGAVSGDISYGSLEIAKGGELIGSLTQI
ncbi:CcmA Integral membrane protein CcmA involved in cell shape determination [Oxalobacteraceae bacterium]